MSEEWIEVQIETTPDGADLLAAAVAELTGGVEIRDADTIFPTVKDRCTLVALLRPDAVDGLLELVDDTLALARGGGTTVDPVGIRKRAAHEDEWRDVWKQFFRATRIGRRFVVRPSWDQGPGVTAEHVIDLDPGRAFGTGAHASTRLVIQLLETLAERRPTIASFLDLGCGSGILAIVARRLWPASQGLAVDNDVEATDCTLENFERNGIGDVVVRTGTLAVVSERALDVVVANIQADVLTSLAPELPQHLAADGHLILSGLLTRDVDAIVSIYQAHGVQLLKRIDEGEWGALLFQRAHA